MKEAAGEANLTVVAIILIAVIVAVATPLISNLMKSSAKKSCCTDSGGVVTHSIIPDADLGYSLGSWVHTDKESQPLL